MSVSAKKPFRKRRLFPRSLEEALKDATKPLMSKQGKLYSALLRDWAAIVGTERAALTRPQRLQFPSTHDHGATLHLHVRPAAAPELTYALDVMLEQCARYFGYRAIERIVLHPAYGMFEAEAAATEAITTDHAIAAVPPAMPSNSAMSPEMRHTLARIAAHLTKKN